jgi:aminomethyltransferase
MKNMRCKYGFLLNGNGTILDDLIAYRKADDEWMLVVNASTKDRDFSIIKQQLSSAASLVNISDRTVKIDVQGPGSPEVMVRFAGDDLNKLSYFGFDFFSIMGGKCIISKTGYTGELGYEIYADPEIGVELWQELIKDPAVNPAGLGARDILRTEMGYPLYGNELTEEYTPLDCGMDRFLDMEKHFTGRESLLEQRRRGVRWHLVGFVSSDRRTPRHGNRIHADKGEAGFVTSGVFSPHLNRGIGMGYIDSAGYDAVRDIFIYTGRDEMHATVESVPFLKKTSIHKREA